jgi:hypothetical protein
MQQTIPTHSQIWEHVASGRRLLIENIGHGAAAWCVLLESSDRRIKYTNLRVRIPLYRFRDYGDRGLRFVRKKGGKRRSRGGSWRYGTYDPRRKNLGAIQTAGNGS